MSHVKLLLARRLHAVAIRLLCGVMLLLTLTPAHAAPSEYELKAAFIYQIAKFVEWPSAGAPVNAGMSLRLCVLGGNPFGPALESIRGKPVNERRMEVSLLDMNAGISGCAMLFIAAPMERHIERITALSRGTGVLTIGDTQGFAQRGVMVNFFSQDGKIRFEVNLDATRHDGLKISSKLLSLARIVDSGIVDSGITH
ncbi:MAG: YfiR family protein [Candidatus Ferrigenium altingense]